MYCNRVNYILKDKAGNTVGAEVEVNGKLLRLRNSDLKLQKFNFMNATVDKNGYVRAKSGNLPKKEHKMKKVLHNKRTIEKPAMHNSKLSRLQVSKENSGSKLVIGNGSKDEYVILIEDSESGYVLYTAILAYWFSKNCELIPDITIKIYTSDGKSGIINKLLEYTNSVEIKGCLVIMDKLGEYKDLRNKSDIIERISGLLDDLGSRSGLYAPLSAEFAISTYKLLYQDLSVGSTGNTCLPDRTKWFSGYLYDVLDKYSKSIPCIAKGLDSGTMQYMEGRYDKYVLENIYGKRVVEKSVSSNAKLSLPTLEKQIFHIINFGLSNTSYSYKKSRLSACFYSPCCYLVEDTDKAMAVCGKLGYHKNKMEEWFNNSCIELLGQLLSSIFVGNRETQSDENVICHMY